MARRTSMLMTAVCITLVQGACASGRHTEQMPAALDVSYGDSLAGAPVPGASGAAQKILPRDLLEVAVFEAPELSRSVQVSDAGTISLPLLGNVRAAGHTPQELEVVLQDTLRRTYMRDPRVTVEIKQAAARPIYVVGEVTQPGAFLQTGQDRLTVLRALALARGVKPTGAQTRTIVIRPRASGDPLQIPVNVSDVVRGRAPDHRLLPNDVVYVPKNGERAVMLGVVDALVRVVTFRAVF